MTFELEEKHSRINEFENMSSCRLVPYSHCACTYFNNTNLSGMDLTGINLEGADFSYVNLSDAKLDYAKLNNVEFTVSNLTGTTFVFAEINSGRIQKTILEASYFVCGELKKIRLR